MESPDLRTFNEAAPVTLPLTFPVKLAETVPALKFPEPSLLTIVLTVLALVAALARSWAVLILAAVEPPTDATVAAELPPVPVAVTSPVRAVISVKKPWT